MRKCSECKENVAVLYIQDAFDKTKLRGYCLSCAKKLNVPGIDMILKQSGIDEDNLEEITMQMNEASEMLEEQMSNVDYTQASDFLENIVSSDEFKSVAKKFEDILNDKNSDKQNEKTSDAKDYYKSDDNSFGDGIKSMIEHYRDISDKDKLEKYTKMNDFFNNYNFDDKKVKDVLERMMNMQDKDNNLDKDFEKDNKDLDKEDNKSKLPIEKDTKKEDVDKTSKDDELIDISAFENELKKMIGSGNGGIFEINVSGGNVFSDMNNIFSDKEDLNSDKNVSKDNKKSDKKKSIKNIEKFGRNLTKLANEGKIDPVIGRQNEIDRVIQILNRRTKNNPVLIGEPGVGKTAIAEGLAYKISNGDVPQKLLDYEILQLELSSIVAGTQFRGQFESRMKNIMDEAEKHGKIILVIDEIHSIVGAGDANGSMDAANILKLALSKGDVQIIGATTINEYKKYIEKDKALERRFQSILVEEPTVEETINIIKGLKEYYENYHKINLSDEVIKGAVRLSDRYITDRFLPDKAIDVIDEVGSKSNLNNNIIHQIEAIIQSIDTIKQKQEESSKNEDYEKVANYKTQEIKLEQDLEKLKEREYTTVTLEDVADVIEQWTKIPIKEITLEETDKLMSLENKLKESIVGQDDAINSVSKAIRRNRAGISAVKKPSSFIFVGPTGVGKTQLVKSLAKEIFGSEDMIIRVDMSEYMEKHSVSKFIGSPPGYVGFDEGGQLTDKVKRKPYSIILLDEIEKAHPDVFNMMLQILDEGKLTDSQGTVVHFENTIIIMTSNIGTTFKNKSLGFANSQEEQEKQRVYDALKENFKPEFLNRIDDIVIFNKLTKADLRKIVDILISKLQEVIKDKGIKINITDEVRDFIVEKGYDEKYGARPLRRMIQKYVEDEIADIFIMQDITKINMLTLQLLNQKILVEKALK